MHTNKYFPMIRVPNRKPQNNLNNTYFHTHSHHHHTQITPHKPTLTPHTDHTIQTTPHTYVLGTTIKLYSRKIVALANYPRCCSILFRPHSNSVCHEVLGGARTHYPNNSVCVCVPSAYLWCLSSDLSGTSKRAVNLT